VRWYQLGIFMPWFRGHSSKWCPRREPWNYDATHVQMLKKTILMRYRLLPYWYTLFENHHHSGMPVIRPLWVNYPELNDNLLIAEEHRFMLGDALLVTPILAENVKAIEEPLLYGLDKDRWYDLYGLTEVKKGEKVTVELERMGTFIRGGHIIPAFLIDTDIKSSQDCRHCDYGLIIALDKDNKASGTLYIDDGSSFNYKKGEFLRYEFHYDNGQFKANVVHKHYKIHNKFTKVTILGLTTQPSTVSFLEGAHKEIEVHPSKVILIDDRVFFPIEIAFGSNFVVNVQL